MEEKGTLSLQLYEDLFRGNREVFESLAYSYVRNKEEARDIVSQCFAKLWEKRDTIIPDSVVGYMFTTVRNACLDYRKAARNKAHGETLREKEGDLLDYYSSVIEQNDLPGLYIDDIINLSRKTLEKMPDERRAAFLKNRIEGLTYEEIAEAMGISRARVNKDMHAALQDLRLSLKDYLALFIVLTLLENIK